MSSLASSFFAASARSVPFRELLRVPAIPRSICNIMDADAFDIPAALPGGGGSPAADRVAASSVARRSGEPMGTDGGV